jgi:hypothetical protein
VLAPLDAGAATAARRSARTGRTTGGVFDSEMMPRTASDERESNLAISELAAKARWKQLLSGVKVGDTTVVLRLLHEVRDLADAPSPTAVRGGLLSRSKASSGAAEPYGSQRRPLHYAALYKQPKVAKVLLAHGANPNATDKQGWAPLHCAALNGNIAVAQMLLAAGAAPHARVFLQGIPDQGETAAAFARRHQQDAVAEVIEGHAVATARVLAYQRLAWASAFHARLGADSCVPSSLGRPSVGPPRAVPAPDLAPAAAAAAGTSPTGEALQAVSRSVALGCLADLPSESVMARVARPFASLRDATGAVIWQPSPTRELMQRCWIEDNPHWQPSATALQELPWCG